MIHSNTLSHNSKILKINLIPQFTKIKGRANHGKSLFERLITPFYPFTYANIQINNININMYLKS
nr:MAG TPA: hypothetical protein [Caudoviricetes sp.]